MAAPGEVEHQRHRHPGGEPGGKCGGAHSDQRSVRLPAAHADSRPWPTGGAWASTSSPSLQSGRRGSFVFGASAPPPVCPRARPTSTENGPSAQRREVAGSISRLDMRPSLLSWQREPAYGLVRRNRGGSPRHRGGLWVSPGLAHRGDARTFTPRVLRSACSDRKVSRGGADARCPRRGASRVGAATAPRIAGFETLRLVA